MGKGTGTPHLMRSRAIMAARPGLRLEELPGYAQWPGMQWMARAIRVCVTVQLAVWTWPGDADGAGH